MKGFILAAIFSVLYVAIVVVFFRKGLPEFRAAFMVRMYLISVPLLLLIFSITPADLYFLTEELVEHNGWLDGSFGLFTYSASVFGGWLQLYNLADRGLSLRILIDAVENTDVNLTPVFVQATYGKGKGIKWMYAKRLGDLERIGLVRKVENSLGLTDKGSRHAKLILKLRALYKITTNKKNQNL